jgi:ABC-type molybdate transport system substrate-binding protein
MNIRAIVLGVAVAASSLARAEEQAVRLYAAGSLRGAMSEVAQAFTAAGGPPVTATFGASGLLRERIEKGEAVDVFASADLGNPQALARAGLARPPIVFTRNRLCAIVAPGVDATAETLLDRMLDPSVRLGRIDDDERRGAGSHALRRVRALRQGSGDACAPRFRAARGALSRDDATGPTRRL